MKQFLPEDILEFLQKTDEFLKADCDLIVIGGAAASLAYGVTKTTTDIDLATEIPKHLQEALKLASEETGITIPVSYVGQYEPPYDFESRLKTIDNFEFRMLNLSVPEQHDLALMKMVRGYENDIQAIEEMHEAQPFELEIFIERFMNEMTQAIGNPGMIRLNFLLMTEKLFGSAAMSEVDTMTEAWTPLHPHKLSIS
jgi:hypothetical protein